MANKLTGTWILESSHNFDAFLQEIGVSEELRKASQSLKPTFIIETDGDKWSVNFRSTVMNKDDPFVIGVEKDDVTMTGRQIRVVRRIEGDKLITEQRDKSTGNIFFIVENFVDSDGHMIEYIQLTEKENDKELDSEENMDTNMDSILNDSGHENSQVKQEHDPVEELKSMLSTMSAQTKKATESMLSKDEEIREHCMSLRIKVDGQTEVMIEEIRQWNVDTRDRINTYEKECLGKFNAEQFEASASALKSLLAEITEHQSRIEQQIKEANSDTQKVNEMIEETLTKIQALELENLKLSKQKFGDFVLDIAIDENKKIDPRASLIKSTIFSLESMQYLSTVRDMPGFKSLSYCFINPFAASHEFIAIVEKSDNQFVLVKMDTRGKILKEKPCSDEFDTQLGIYQLQTVKDCFIVQDSSSQYKRFDYDLNQLETKPVKIDLIDPGFTANQWYVINARVNLEYLLGKGPRLICLSRHDLSEEIDRAPDECEVDKIDQMLASDKYLYIWHDRENVRVIDIDCDESKDKFEGRLYDCKLVDDKPFEPGYSGVKLFGDEYIAVHNKRKATVCLYTQDAKIDMVKKHKIKLDKEFKMSNDASNGFCFFNTRGDIYHTLI